MGASADQADRADRADRDGLGRVRMVVDVDLIVDRNAAAAYAVCVRHGNFGVIAEATATGSAKREPGEVFDSGVARGLAVGRALMELGAVLVSQAELKVMLMGEAARLEAEMRLEQKRARQEWALISRMEAKSRRQMFRDVIADRAKWQGTAEGKVPVAVEALEKQLENWFDYQKGCWKAGTEDFLEAWKIVP